MLNVLFFIWGLVMAGCGVAAIIALGVLLAFQGGLVMANKWIKIAVHYGTTFAVGAIATWIFQWTAVEWLVYFVFCDLWYILRETRDSDD